MRVHSKIFLCICGIGIATMAVTGCSSGSGSGSGAVGNMTSQYVLGTLPDGATIVASSNNLTADTSHSGLVMGTISVYGGTSNNKYTLTLNELDKNNLFIDSAAQLQPANCTISAGQSCNIVYPEFSSTALDKMVKVSASLNNQSQVTLPNSINVKIKAVEPAITAMVYDDAGNNIYSGDSLGNLKYAPSKANLNWNLVNDFSNAIVNMAVDGNSNIYVTTRNDETGSISSYSCNISSTCTQLNLPVELGTYFYTIKTDSNNNVYASGWNSAGGAIYKLPSGSSQWQNVFQVPNVPGNARGSYVTALAVDNVSGNLYFGTFSGSVYTDSLSNISQATPLPQLPAAVNSRITEITPGVYTDTPLVVATYSDGVLMLSGAPGSYSWNIILSPSTSPSLNNFIQDMKLVKDNIYPSSMECSILFFIQPGSQQLWSSELCGPGNIGEASNLASTSFDQNNMEPSAGLTQFVVASNNNIYAGATDGSVSTKITPPPVFSKFSLVAPDIDGGNYICPGQINGYNITVAIDSDVPPFTNANPGLYDMSASIDSLAPIHVPVGLVGFAGYVSIGGSVQAGGTLQVLWNDPNGGGFGISPNANYYCTNGTCGSQTFTYISRYGNESSTYNVSVVPNTSATPNCTDSF